MSNKRVIIHYGVKGMRWGIRKDRHRGPGHRRYSTLSDKELSRRIERLSLEKKYRDLHNDIHSSAGKRIVSQSFESASKTVLTAQAALVLGLLIKKGVDYANNI